MRKKICVVICLLITLALTGCSGSLKNFREISYEGTELTVSLGADKATGYEWQAVINGDCIRRSVNRSYELVDISKGKSHNGFEGLSAGEATIVFTTPVGWDGTGEGDTYIVDVEVGPDGTILSAEEATTP